MMVIDGLQCGRYDRKVLEDLIAGGVAAITVTVAFWDDALETMDAIADWNALIAACEDIALLARTADDVRQAHAEGRVAIILGSQNSSPINDRLGFVELFADMGLRVMQLTYNNQNAIGGSCYEASDSGLSRFGREVIREMNRVGMLVDLSHVGERTSLGAIECSDVPVAITHANPKSLFNHPRNKSDELLRALAANGGILGLATYNNICGPYAATPQAWCEMVARTVDLLGIDAVAIGTDLAPNSGADRLEWMRKGRWTRSEQHGAALPGVDAVPREWLRTPRQFSELIEVLQTSGHFTTDEVQAIAADNWLRVYKQTFSPA